MSNLIDKAVWLEDMARVHNAIDLLERIYETDAWTGAMLFQDNNGGFVLLACFDPEQYPGESIRFEALFSPRDLPDLTLDQACSLSGRFRPWLRDGVPDALRRLKLLPG